MNIFTLINYFRLQYMRRNFLILILFLFISNTSAFSQQIIMGSNNYVEYHVGTLPFVISVSHGGALEPSSIPDRRCKKPVYDTDSFTIETALEIKKTLFALTGCYPHLIISNLKRSKLDPNRGIDEGACGNLVAETAWNEFHNFIKVARNSANEQFNNKTFFVDLHGHGNSIPRIELGYLLYDDELEKTDIVLNTKDYIDNSSIGNLANSNLNNFTHAQLLKGPKSFGTLLANYNFPSVPSQGTPFPGTTSNYFSGGYILANNSSYKSRANISGLQMELNYDGVRDTPVNRTKLANAFSKVLIEYMNAHFNIIWNSCTPLSTEKKDLNVLPEFYPNPVKKGDFFYFDNLEDKIYNYSIYNYIGQIFEVGYLKNSKNTIGTKNLDFGNYLIQLFDKKSGEKATKKLIIN